MGRRLEKARHEVKKRQVKYACCFFREAERGEEKAGRWKNQ